MPRSIFNFVISNISNIAPDQAGYLKGRYIGDNIRAMLDILEITKLKIDSGILVMVDFEKAFDIISWAFLYKTLDYFDFCPIFKKYVKLLYTSPECSVTNNGFHSEFFSITRGIRQGCPISALLFILCVEVLTIYNVVVVTVNIYAPTKDDAYSQKVFYDELAKNLDTYIDCNIIIGGDFNVCLNPTLDKQGGNQRKTVTLCQTD